MHGTFSTRGKQSKPFFKSNFLYLWHFTIVLPNLKTSPHPLACIFSHFLLGLICLSPAQISKAMASTGQASYDFKTSLFSSSPVILFFHHLSHTTLHLLNCPILLQHPSSLVLKQFSAFNHWCQLNFSSCSSYTCSRQNCWMTWKTKKYSFQFPYGIIHCWSHMDLRFPSMCPLLTGVWWEVDANGRSNRSPRH